MKRILVISGSRADYGMLEWPVKVLAESFDVDFFELDAGNPADAIINASHRIGFTSPNCVLLLGDRWEILQAAIAAHLVRIPIAHLCGGDVTEGSYDDAMRDCISRLATWHFPTSTQSAERLKALGYKNVHMVGSTGVDYIMHADWMRERPTPESYVVVSYQPETIDDTVDLDAVKDAVAGRRAIWITPNPDRGSERIPVGESFGHAEFLNLLFHCEEFIGNSSAIFYEAPFLGVKTNLIGRRQDGRVVPFGDGKASERIREVLCRSL